MLGGLGRRRVAVADSPAPAEPDAAAPPQRWADRDFQAAGARPAVGHADAIGDYDEPRQYRSPQLRDNLIALEINPDIE